MKAIIETQFADICNSFLGKLQVKIAYHIYVDGTYDEIVIATIGVGTRMQRTIVEDRPIDDFAHLRFIHGVGKAHIICQALMQEYYEECCEIEMDCVEELEFDLLQRIA